MHLQDSRAAIMRCTASGSEHTSVPTIKNFIRLLESLGYEYDPDQNNDIYDLFSWIQNIGNITVIGIFRKRISDDYDMTDECAFAVDGLSRILAAPLDSKDCVSVVAQIDDDDRLIKTGLYTDTPYLDYRGTFRSESLNCEPIGTINTNDAWNYMENNKDKFEANLAKLQWSF